MFLQIRIVFNYYLTFWHTYCTSFRRILTIKIKFYEKVHM